jgi:hypothetical protein
LIGGSRKVVAGDDDQEHVVFKLVMRAAKGGKQGTVTRDLLVPADNEIAISTATNEEAEREAKERRKETLLRQWEQEEKAQALQTAGEHTFYDPFIHPLHIRISSSSELCLSSVIGAQRREPSAVWHPSASATYKEPEPVHGMDSYFDWNFACNSSLFIPCILLFLMHLLPRTSLFVSS